MSSSTIGSKAAAAKVRFRLLARHPFLALLVAAALFLPHAARCTAEGTGAEKKPAEPALVVIVMQEGQEIIGEIVSENETQVTVKTTFGTFPLARDKIKEIRRDADVVRLEWEERFLSISGKKDVAKLLELAAWAADKGLRSEQQETFAKVIEIEPANEAARRGLGHARLEGAWVDEKRVQDLLADGYVLEGLELVKKLDASSTGVAGGGSGEEKITKEEQKRREKERKKAEKFRKHKEQEFEGVPWEKHHVLKTPHYEIHCNSTERVTQYYGKIMEEIFESLSKKFTGNDQQTGRSAVYIYKTQSEFYEKNQFPPNSGIGAYYNPMNQSIHGYHGTFALTGSTFGVLCHEAVHQFQGRKLGLMPMSRMPKWLIEGMAVYFGDGSRIDYDKDRVVSGLIFRDRLLSLKRRYEEGTNERLAKLIEMDQDFGGPQYSDSWSVINYLFSGPEKESGREMLIALWNKGSDPDQRITSKDFRTLADKHFGGLKVLEQKIIDYTKTLQPEPNGVAEGEEFVSKEFMFRVTRPDASWNFNLVNDAFNVLVDLAAPESAAAIRVVIENKPDIVLEDEDFVDQVFGEQFQKRYKIIERTTRQFAVQDAHVITYVDRPPAEEKPKDPPAGGALPPPDGKTGGEAKPASPPPPIRRHRAYCFPHVDKAFIVIGSAEEANFSRFEGDFLRAAQSFKIELKNRW